MATPNLGRRGLFGSAAAVALLAQRTTASAQPIDGDTELLKLCAEFQTLHADLIRMVEEEAPDDVYDPVNARWWAVLREAMDIPASTHDGIRAKARLYLPAMQNTIGEPPFAEVGHELAHALVDDILGRARG